MRANWFIEGINSDMKEGSDLCKVEVFLVNFTKDTEGATLSIGSYDDEKQYTIPLDFIIEKLKKGGHI